MEIERYAEFSQRFHRSVVDRRIPIEGTIEVTRRCPLTCAHCYNNLPMWDHTARHQEMSMEEHRRLLDELAEAGCLWLLYTGGEIFARRDFLEIYTYAKRKGFLITLFTNGTLLTPRIADYLVKWRPFAIEITLYGRTKETYEQLTGIPGSYEKCMQGINLLLERKLPLKLKTVAVTLNRHEVGSMKRFAEEELGVEFKFDAMMSPRIDCSQSPLAVRLTPAEIVAFDLDDPKRRAEWQNFSAHFSGPANPPEQAGELYHCGGGLTSFAVDPYGEMSICVLSHMDTYNLRQGSFRRGWEDFLFKVRRRETTMLTKCVSCHLKAMCGMCPANGELENGDPEQPVDFLCHVAHLRAHLFGLEVVSHGDCEYCEGGAKYGLLLNSVEALEDQGRVPWQFQRGMRKSLPVINQLSTGGVSVPSGDGCASCHSHP